MKSDRGVVFPELTLETRPGANGTTEKRVCDYVRKIRTPWLFYGASDHVAACAVNRTNLERLTSRHSKDGDWIIVHSY